MWVWVDFIFNWFNPFTIAFISSSIHYDNVILFFGLILSAQKILVYIFNNTNFRARKQPNKVSCAEKLFWFLSVGYKVKVKHKLLLLWLSKCFLYTTVRIDHLEMTIIVCVFLDYIIICGIFHYCSSVLDYVKSVSQIQPHTHLNLCIFYSPSVCYPANCMIVLRFFCTAQNKKREKMLVFFKFKRNILFFFANLYEIISV